MNAIPTTYKGYRFRSRLEARWAAFFDLVEWPWEYEPFDFDGYIPDFLLKFPHAPILYEVKPDVDSHIKEAIIKIDRSNWDKEAVIFTGVVQPDIGWTRLGLLREGREWDACNLHFCDKCRRVSFHHESWTYFCRVSGCYEGDHHLHEYNDAGRLWALAANRTQWNPV